MVFFFGGGIVFLMNSAEDRIVFSADSAGTIGYSYANHELAPLTYHTHNLKCILDMNVKPKL